MGRLADKFRGIWSGVAEKSPRRAIAAVQRLFVRRRYDSAQTTPDNQRHWRNADFLSANAANRPEVRRSAACPHRYEVANNSYARGIVLTLANDVIGTGPRLQMLLGDGENDDGNNINGLIEREFAAWAKVVDLAGKLRTMRMAKAKDGETFGLLHTNHRLPHAVQLDLRLIEADQVATPLMEMPTPTFVDGIVFDTDGNPMTYHILDRHPGDAVIIAPLAFREVSAAAVIHWFRADRPEQRRGLPDILPALPLFAQLRRYTLAVIAAAESAANVAIFMKTTAPPGGEAAEVDAGVTMDFEPNMAVFGPEGWEPTQIRAEQPATTYEMFKHEILNEIARCLNMPYNIAACNSSGYNYSSGRLDHQTYYKSIRVEQAHIETLILDKILATWLAEAAKAYRLAVPADVPHQWFWDGHERVDPQKEAAAQAQRLASNTTTLATEYARQGKDWETELRQRAKELALMRELGLPLVEPKGVAVEPDPAPGNQQQDDNGEQGDGEQKQPAGRARRSRAA